MNWKSICQKAPYILLIIANFIYIYANGFHPIGHYPKLFLYNMVFFVLVGVVVMIKVNLVLHSWFVKQEGDAKQKTKKVIKQIFLKVNFISSIFTRGNEKMMIKIYLTLTVWILLNKFIPTFLMGILVATYFQYKGFIQQVLKEQFRKLNDLNQELSKGLIYKVPKYHKITIQTQ